MVDNLPPQQPTDPAAVDPAAASAAAPSSGTGFSEFLKSTTGKIVLGVVAGMILLAIVAVVGIFLFMSGSTTSSDLAVKNAGGTVTTTATASGVPASAIEEPPPVALSDVFTFRDVFEPTVVPAVVATDTAASSSTTSSTTTSTSGGSSSTTSTSGGGSADRSADTLYLDDIKTVDGKQVAVLTYNGTTYELSAGERVGSTPWKVLEVNESSVVMLYGDTQVTLSVGQGITK